jgi:hypothetical protein
LGMVGCEVVSDTANAVAVMPGVLATTSNGGAVGSGEDSDPSIAWHCAQIFSA